MFSFQRVEVLRNVNFSVSRIGSPLLWRGVRGEALEEQWSLKDVKMYTCHWQFIVSLSLSKGDGEGLGVRP
jgi:hypothetical protein